MNTLREIINANSHYIGEILVVVLGVLIAFFITKLNRERARKKRIKGILDIIKLNMITDIKSIDKELDLIDKTEKSIIKALDPKNNFEILSEDERWEVFSFLFIHPTFMIQKEGFYLLRDADFNYDLKKNKILSEIINLYHLHIANIERERDRVIRTSENNTLNHISDPWLYSDQYTEEGKSKIFNYLEDNLLKDDFINEIDYMSQCIFEFGVIARGIIEQENINGSEFATLAAASVNVLSHTGIANQFHHKYAIIDANNISADPIVLTGSHNWSANAENNSDENTMIIHDHTIANIYLQEFEERWGELGGSTDINNELNSKISVYPNPSKGIINIISDLTIDYINLYNVEGKLLETSEKKSFFIKNKGIFFVKIRTINGEESIKKVVIE